jgi:hypothetical protein
VSETATDSKSLRIPTLSEVLRRRSELLAQHAASQPEPQSSEDFLEDPAMDFTAENPVEDFVDHPDEELASPAPPRTPPWPTLAATAYHGLAGLVVRTIAPHTEADPAAILLQFLAAFGNIVGPAPHCMVESTRHSLNLFVVLVGESSKARKGSSWRQISRLFSEIDGPWIDGRVTSARLSADGLIHALRDEDSATDRRLLLLSEEFASVLQALGRESSHLSPLLRCAWDTGNLRTLDRHHPLQATGTHISLIGHITQHELVQHLHRTGSHNGFANRCLWTCVRRSQCLPNGGSLAPDTIAGLARDLRSILNWVETGAERPFCRDAAASEFWDARYESLSQAWPGICGAATNRAEAQVLRLSATYAVLDRSPVVALPHLQAALAVWNYCADSAGYIFGNATGDPTVDRIRQAIESSPNGLTREQIRKFFNGHLSSQRIDAALQQLMTLGAVTSKSLSGNGRPHTLWSPTDVDINQPA